MVVYLYNKFHESINSYVIDLERETLFDKILNIGYLNSLLVLILMTIMCWFWWFHLSLVLILGEPLCADSKPNYPIWLFFHSLHCSPVNWDLFWTKSGKLNTLVWPCSWMPPVCQPEEMMTHFLQMNQEGCLPWANLQG